jgi:hypothetical protein
MYLKSVVFLSASCCILASIDFSWTTEFFSNKESFVKIRYQCLDQSSSVERLLSVWKAQINILTFN